MDQHPAEKISILVLCTANICRSPMAAALLGRRLASAGVPGTVHSAGVLGDGNGSPDEVIAAMAAYGLDIAGHRSHEVTPADLVAADLVLAMTREHLRQAVIAAPQIWPQAFTMKELDRRGQQTGPRKPGEPLAGWLARVHDGRTRMALLGDSPEDDVADPIGGPPQAYFAAAGLLDQLAAELVALGWSGWAGA